MKPANSIRKLTNFPVRVLKAFAPPLSLTLALFLAMVMPSFGQDGVKASLEPAHGVTKIAGTAPPPVSEIYYGGGPVMSGATNVYVIYYGTWPAASQTIVNTWLQHIGGSSLFNINTAYRSSTEATVQNIVNYNPAANSYNDNYSLGKSLTDANVQTVISNAIAGKHLPADQNGVYFVLTAQDVTETATGVGTLCVNMCGYHSPSTSIVTGDTIKYSLVGNPAACPQACDGNIFQGDPTTPNNDVGGDGAVSVMFHELSETVTDPDVTIAGSGAWGADVTYEVGDFCAWNFGNWNTLPKTAKGAHYDVTINGLNYLIQQLFEVDVPSPVGGTYYQGSCQPALSGIVASEMDTADTLNSIYYLGFDSNLYQFGWDWGWTWHQETGVGGRPSVAAGTGVSAYVNTIYNGNEVFYLTNVNGNLHIEQIWGSPVAPSAGDLTAATAGKAVAGGTSPVGFIDTIANQDNVFFIGADQFVHVLTWTPAGGWKEDANLDVTVMTAASIGSSLSGHMMAGSEEVFYIGANQHVYEVWRWSKNFDGWHTTDVTAANGLKPVAEIGSPLAGFYDSVAKQDAMFYIGTNQHVYELVFPGTAIWSSVDITAKIGGVNASPVSTLAAHLNTLANANSEEVFFLDGNQNIQELWASSNTPNNWNANNVTVASGGAPLAASASPLSANVSTIDNTDHVFYVSLDQNMHELWWNGAWHNADDNTQTNPVAPNAVP